MVELEALAIYWAIKKCYIFLAGLEHFTVVSDHKPLQPIFNNHTLDMIENPRVQNYRQKLMGYNFTVEWRKGKDHAIPDALSRAPVADPSDEDIEIDTSCQHVATIQAKDTDLVLDESR